MPETPGESIIQGALGLGSGGSAGGTPAPAPSAQAGASPTPGTPPTPAAPSAAGGSQPQGEAEIPREYHKDPRWQKLYGRMKDAESWKAENSQDLELGRIVRMAQQGDTHAARLLAAQIGADFDMVDEPGASAGVPGEAAAPLSRSELDQLLASRDEQRMRQMAVWSKVQEMHRRGLEFKDEDVYAAMIDRGINDPEDAYYVANREALIQKAIEDDRAARGATAAAQVAAGQNVPPGTNPSASTVPSSQEPSFQGRIVQAHLANNNPIGQMFPGLNLGQKE